MTEPSQGEQQYAAYRQTLACPKCDNSGLLDPDGTTVKRCDCEHGRRRAAPVIRHPGKTHEEVLTFLAEFEGTLGLGTDEKDAIRWARGRIADLTGDVERYVALLVAKDEELAAVKGEPA